MIHSYLNLDSKKKSLRICVILAKHLFFEKIQLKYNSQLNQLRLADSFKASKQLTLQLVSNDVTGKSDHNFPLSGELG